MPRGSRSNASKAKPTSTGKASPLKSEPITVRDPKQEAKVKTEVADADDDAPTSSRTYPAVHDRDLRMSYRIARGEQGVLTFEPYKSMLLPLWRFRTPPIARASSVALWERFVDFDAHEDFVGMDMTRYVKSSLKLGEVRYVVLNLPAVQRANLTK